MMTKTIIAALALFISASTLAATPWQKITQPIPGTPQSIGAFANGCIVGAQGLPIQSDNYQVMRTDQRRYFGHPDLLLFIQRLTSKVHNLGLGTVLIGDMGMPAGGRFNGGHASHQSGLDVDIFLQLPKTRWTSAQLLKPQALDLVSRDGKHVVSSLWQPDIASLIKAAAQDSEVTRMRRLNNSCAWMLETIATGSIKSVRGSSIARICTFASAVRRTVWSARIRPRRRRAMAAVKSYKAGLSPRNREPRLRRKRRLRCILPARHYWTSTHCKWTLSVNFL